MEHNSAFHGGRVETCDRIIWLKMAPIVGQDDLRMTMHGSNLYPYFNLFSSPGM